MGSAELTIEGLGPKGDGIAYGARERVYVDRTVPGDLIRARIHRDDQGLARAEIVEILAPSPYRQKAPCAHYDRCGGCTLQHLSPEFYREQKIEWVREAFRKQHVHPRHWLEPIFIGGHNRRRATFASYKNRDRMVLGYYRRRSQEISDIESCLIADPKLLALRAAIQPFLGPVLPPGKPVGIFLQLVGGAVDVVLTGPVGRGGEPDTEVRRALGRLLEAAPVTRISWRAREDAPVETLLSKGLIRACFGALEVNLPPSAFLQPTPEGEKALTRAVLAALPPRGKFADLFSGCGTFSGPILERGAVDAYESAAPSVKALSKAAGKLRLRVFRRDLFRNPLCRDEINRYDAVVFDPPRAGCPEQATAMALAKTGTLVGVSCNPATFARDARILCEGGYRLQSLQIVDQFLWSHHVEVVGVFKKGR